MEYKSLMLTLKEDGPEGSFLARIATLNEIDKDGDVTLAGAFPPAKEVLVSSYMHGSWEGALPVGKAVIREIGNEVLAEGQFNMDSETGREHYAAVKFSGNLQEWSYGFKINQSEPGTFQGQNVRFLKGVDPFEISPVLVGAGNGTATLAIKSAQTYADQGDRLLADLVEYAERTKELAALRAKDGRMISAANMDRLRAMMERVQSVMEEMAALMEEATPPAKGAMQVWAEYHRLKAKLRSS